MKKVKTPKIEGFWVLQDIATGKYLAGSSSSSLTKAALIDFGPGVAIFRSNKNAEKAAKGAVQEFLKHKEHWAKDEEWGKEQYGREFLGVKVVELEVTPKQSLTYWDITVKE